MNTAYVDKTVQHDVPQPAPLQASSALDYASPGIRSQPPFDFVGALRQTIFALGVGLLVFGVMVCWGSERAWSENVGAFGGIGAGPIAWTIPWPGRLGRKRGE
jgi:hypothetical protein